MQALSFLKDNLSMLPLHTLLWLRRKTQLKSTTGCSILTTVGREFVWAITNNKRRCSCPLIFGKCFCPIIPKGCAGKWQTFGHHVGDWEGLYVNLRKNGEPINIVLRAHSSKYTYTYDGKYFKHKKEALWFHGTHPIIYSAKGSHGARARPGRHVYKTLINKSELADGNEQRCSLEDVD